MTARANWAERRRVPVWVNRAELGHLQAMLERDEADKAHPLRRKCAHPLHRLHRKVKRARARRDKAVARSHR